MLLILLVPLVCMTVLSVESLPAPAVIKLHQRFAELMDWCPQHQTYAFPPATTRFETRHLEAEKVKLQRQVAETKAALRAKER